MSIILKKSKVKIRDSDGNYTGVFNAVAEKKSTDYVVSVETAGKKVLDSIPESYDKVLEEISDLKEEKVDYTLNIARISNLLKVSSLSSDIVENDDGSLTVTPKVSYGRCDFSYSIQKQNNKRYFYFSATVSKDDITTAFSSCVYCYNGKTNLGMINVTHRKLVKISDNCYNLMEIWELLDTQYDVDHIDIGILTTIGIPYVITKKSMLVIDFTDILEDVDAENILDICIDYFGTEYMDKFMTTEKYISSVEKKIVTKVTNTWKNKNVLVIGDSITAAQKWQKKLNEMLELNVSTHAKGGVDTIAMVDGDKGLGGNYDNETSASGTLKPLSVDDVKDKDLIIVLPAYNDRGKADGTIGDCYDSNSGDHSTIAGIVQYTINRIYELLSSAENLKCKILYATPHCAGRYPYIDVDGYGEYPSGTGRTMETLANTIVSVCNYNNIPVCDLWHNSGIGKYTWNIFGLRPNAVNNQYTPYELDSEGKAINSTRVRYVKGQSYYQIRNGSIVFEEYTGSAPYPYNGDQLHCSDEGYARLGECIVGAVVSSFGN